MRYISEIASDGSTSHLKLVHLAWQTYCIPFRRPFLTVHGELCYRTGALISVQTDAGYRGIGEIAPLPTFSGPDLTACLQPLPQLAQALHGMEVEAVLHLLSVQYQNSLPGPLLYGLETALFDALSQMRGENLATLLAQGYPAGPDLARPIRPKTTVPVNAIIGGEQVEQAVQKAREACSAGFSCLKVKVIEASQAAVERIAAIRAAIGPQPRLRLDANAGWNSEQAHFMLEQCAPYDIEYIEQPLPADDLAGMTDLRRTSPIAIAADESIHNQGSVYRILEAEAADVLILKPQLLGGLSTCQRLIQQASQQKRACVITSLLESGVGVSAALHLAAASTEISLACGLATLDLLEDDLLINTLQIDLGYMTVPQGPGLGCSIEPHLEHVFTR